MKEMYRFGGGQVKSDGISATVGHCKATDGSGQDTQKISPRSTTGVSQRVTLTKRCNSVCSSQVQRAKLTRKVLRQKRLLQQIRWNS
jgi:hypothetical protein